MIKAQFLIGQNFLGFDIIKKLKRHIKKPPPPKRQNDILKDKIDLRVFPYLDTVSNLM